MSAVLARTAPYRAVLASRLRSQRSHRASFRVDLLSSLLVGVVELAEVGVLYLQVERIGGLDLAAVLLVFAIAASSAAIPKAGRNDRVTASVTVSSS